MGVVQQQPPKQKRKEFPIKLRRKSISYGHRGMFYCHCHSSDLIVGRIDMSVGHWIKWRTSWSVTVRQFHSILVMSYVLETNAKQRRRCLLKVRNQSSRMWGVYYHNMFCIYIFTIADENLVAILVWNGGNRNVHGKMKTVQEAFWSLLWITTQKIDEMHLELRKRWFDSYYPMGICGTVMTIPSISTCQYGCLYLT